MDDIIWDEFMSYLRYLITSKQLDKNVPEQYKPIIVAHFFNREIYSDGIQSFFEMYPFSLDDVLGAFYTLKVSTELIQVIEETKNHTYINNAELYNQAFDAEEKFEELMEERDEFWDYINSKYYDIKNNDVEEKILSYLKINDIDFKM